MDTPKAGFILFPNLPPELRRLIWLECLPKRRVFELDSPGFHLKYPKCVRYNWSTLESMRPPVITCVCRESRGVAFETGRVDGPDTNYFKEWGLCYPWYIQWFDPTTDLIAMHWTPEAHDGLMGTLHEDPTPLLLRYAPICQGAVISAELVCSWDEPTTSHFDMALLCTLKSWIVCLDMVMVHVTRAEMVNSQLFGTLGEELTQVVDAADVDKMKEFTDLSSNSMGSEVSATRDFFSEMLEAGSFQDRVAEWKQRSTSLWVWHKWLIASETKFDGISKPTEIWRRRRRFTQTPDHEPVSLDMLDQTTYTKRGRLDHVDHARFTPNKQHPWVRETVAEMPTIRPVFVFRPCPMECWRPVTPRMRPQGVHLRIVERI